MTSENRAVHILLPGLSRAPIGGYKVAYEYANALADLGYQVSVWHSSAFLPMRGGLAHAINVAKRRLWDIWTLARNGSAEVSWFDFDPRVGVFTSSSKPRPAVRPGDAVVTTAVQTMGYGAELARSAGARSTALIQHEERWAASDDEIAAAWEASDERVVIAPWLAERCAALGLSSTLIPNAVDASRFPPGPPLADRSPGVLAMVSPHSYKRPDVVIAALTEAGRRHPELIIATFGQSRRLTALPESIRYVRDPSGPELAALYQAATIYLCGSDAEGWHLPPAEATLCGAAVVSTDIAGVRVSMGDEGWYAPPGDWRSLADRIDDVLMDLDEATRRISTCQTRLLARTYQSNAAELAAVVFPANA